MEKPKFEIGDYVYYVESSTHYNKKIPCPMCFGERFVTIILGDNSKEKIICGFCSHGFEYATGQATSWVPHAEIKSGSITGITMRECWCYIVGHNSLEGYKLYDTAIDAKPELEKQLKEVTERAEKFFIDSFIRAKKQQVWSAGYHKSQIKHHEKQMEWHRIRLGMIKERQENDV